MKRKKSQIIYMVLGLLLLNSCRTLDTDLSVSERKMPADFNAPADSDTTGIAVISWRNYFDDTLLLSLIDTALGGNIDLQIALQRIEIARAGAKSARAALLPQVSFKTEGGARRYGLYTMDGAGNISTEILPGKIVPINLPDIYLGLQSSWELDIWGKLRNQRRAAAAAYLESIEGANFVISSLIADVAMAYYELLALDNELEIIRQTILKQQEALEVIRLQKETGRATELAVQQFQAQLLHSEALELEGKQRVVACENLINFLLGRYPQPVERNKDALFREMPHPVSAGIPSRLLANRPDIRAAEFQVQSSRFDLKAAKAAFFPNLNIIAGIGFQAFNPEFLFLAPASIAYTAIGGLTAPLINRNALKAQFSTARARQLSAMYNYQKTILNAYVEVANELSNIRHLEQINLLKQQQRDVLAQSVETSIELYKSARANYLEVLLTQQNSLQTQLELIHASKRKKMAGVNIYKALGGGWE
jgi:multidrug efflux system outer membrane protein